MALVAAACATRQAYTAPSDAPRLNTFTVRDDSDRQLRAECPRLLQARTPATGEAHLRLHVGEDGSVTRSEITRSSGDARIDAIFGQLAARLHLERAPGSTGSQARISMGYSCSDGAAVTTMRFISG